MPSSRLDRTHRFMVAAVALVATASVIDLGTPVPVHGAPGPDPFRAAGVVRLEPPKPAPDLSVLVGEGDRQPLPALRGRAVMVWFFATW